MMQEFNDLCRRIERIEKHLGLEPPKPFVPEPHQPFNPIDRLSMPKSAMDEFVKAVPDRMVRTIVEQDRK